MIAIRFFIINLITCAFFIPVFSAQITDTTFNYENMWNTYDSLSKNGLTQSALNIADTIYKKAKNDNNSQEMIKSLLANLNCIAQKEEEYHLKAITHIETELQSSDFPVEPVLHVLLAEHYFQYYTQNRWRFHNRTQVLNTDLKDIRTWDLKTLFNKTLTEFLAALNKPDDLKKIPIGSLGSIIDNSKESNLRPTLFDVTAHHAVNFLINHESSLTQPSYSFEFDSPVFLKPLNDFVKIKFTSKDSLSPDFIAIKLLQEILKFHISDKNPDALINADLIRLNFVNNRSTLKNKDSLYLETLTSLLKKYSSPAISEVYYQIASYYNTKGTQYSTEDTSGRWYLKKALNICDSAILKHTGSFGAKQCEALKTSIIQKSIDVKVESVVIANATSKALINYRNLSNITIRIVRYNQEQFEKLIQRKSLKDAAKALTSAKPDHQFDIKLKDPGDYHLHSSEISIPALKFGYYIILISNDKNFDVQKSIINYCSFYSSRLSFISKISSDLKGSTVFCVIDRESGMPLSDVTAKVFNSKYDYSKRENIFQLSKTLKTDTNGCITISPPLKNEQNRAFKVVFSKGDDQLNTAYDHYQSLFDPYRIEMNPRTFFFTDRSIYRPGQTISFKGIILSTNGDSSEIIPQQKTTVSILDAHGQKISSFNLKSNDYGTFSGSFTVPQNTLLGSMSISNESGQYYFRVEEYKRPSFEVEISDVKGAYKLNDTITINGKAQSYAGVSTDGATVKYRVFREAVIPFWRCWWIPAPVSPSMEITHGETITNGKGEFQFKFAAISDPQMDEFDNPNFIFKISADVTDINGETRSGASSVTIANSSINFSVLTPNYVNKDIKNSFKINVTNMNNTDENASGTIKIYSLKAPQTPLISRLWKTPDINLMSKDEYKLKFPMEIYSDENIMSSWPRSAKVLETKFDTRKNRDFSITKLDKWSTGAYVMEATTTDPSGREIKDIRYFTLYSTESNKLPYAVSDLFIQLNDTVKPGENARFLIGSGFNNTSVLYELYHKGFVIESKRILLNNSQQIFEIPVKENHRGNISAHFVFSKNNRCFRYDANVIVPWTNKKLDLEFMTFRDLLQPGQKEEWRIKIKGNGKEKAAAEMLATLYDASLDVFAPNSFEFSIYPFRYLSEGWNTSEHIMQTNYGTSIDNFNKYKDYPVRLYPVFSWSNQFPSHNYYGIDRILRDAGGLKAGGSGHIPSSFHQNSQPRLAKVNFASQKYALVSDQSKPEMISAEVSATMPPGYDNKTDLSSVEVRNNFNETAFFYPHLLTDDNGEVSVSFTIPQALTRWKMFGFAHTKDLKYGFIDNVLTTRKDLMITSNTPRFFRENDQITFSAKITNMSGRDLNGTAQLLIFDAVTMKPVDSLFQNSNNKIRFTVKKDLSTPVHWDLDIPENISGICYRIVARADNFSDGEEKIIPVISNRILITEPVPLAINEKGTINFTFNKLLNQNDSSVTLKNHKLTLEFTSNPVWYAIQALPYLIEYPYDCSEKIFARLYANSIASHLVNSNPEIKRVFELWKSYTPQTFLSNLEKNQQLKSVILEETPWLMDSKDEQERKKRIATLFDLNRMSQELGQVQVQLIKMQSPNGGWPWFSGGPDDPYITKLIITGFGRMKKMKVINPETNDNIRQMTENAIEYIDNMAKERYEHLKNNDTLNKNNLSCDDIQYLYTRSFFTDIPIKNRNKESFDYFFNQAKKYWQKTEKYMQGMIALSIYRYQDRNIPAQIIASLKENALFSKETGMYWKEHYENSWYWWQAPIESQALFIEAFDEITNDTVSVDKMKTWLLKNKQTNNWKTTKATTDAIHALLTRGTDMLLKEPDISISLGNVSIDTKKLTDAEAGTGYFQKSWSDDSIKPDMGNIRITKNESGVSWGSLYWQYFEQLDKITTHDTPLKLNKKLFIQKITDTGLKLEPVNEKSNIKPGDKITVRIELRSDRDIEYVHMKDMCAACFEPVNIFSEYKYQDGLGYYESTRDVSTNFFISFLRKGTYVFEYQLVVSHKGSFSNGITTIQCMYAPEFSSHSEGLRVIVDIDE